MDYVIQFLSRAGSTNKKFTVLSSCATDPETIFWNGDVICRSCKSFSGQGWSPAVMCTYCAKDWLLASQARKLMIVEGEPFLDVR